MNYYLKVLRTFNFNGRARRAEFWWFVLFNAIVALILSVIGTMTGLTWSPPTTDVAGAGAAALPPSIFQISIPYAIYYLGVLIQSLAVSVRRLHDRNMTGWWLLAPFIPFVAMNFFSAQPAVAGILALIGLLACIVLLVFFVLPGTVGANKFGEDPKPATAPAAA